MSRRNLFKSEQGLHLTRLGLLSVFLLFPFYGFSETGFSSSAGKDNKSNKINQTGFEIPVAKAVFPSSEQDLKQEFLNKSKISILKVVGESLSRLIPKAEAEGGLVREESEEKACKNLGGRWDDNPDTGGCFDTIVDQHNCLNRPSRGSPWIFLQNNRCVCQSGKNIGDTCYSEFQYKQQKKHRSSEKNRIQNIIEQERSREARESAMSGTNNNTSAKQKSCYDEDGDGDDNCSKPEVEAGAGAGAGAPAPAVDACKKKCQAYINHHSKGCPNSEQAMQSNCNTVCEADSIPAEDHDLFQHIEQSTDRKNCYEDIKTKFKKEYTEGCMQKINSAESKTDTTILCGEGATQEDNKCKTWCERKAQEAADNPEVGVDPTIKVEDEYFENMAHARSASARMSGGAVGDINSYTYTMLINSPDSIPIKRALDKLDLDSLIEGKGGGETSEVKEFCERGKNQKCESKVKYAIRDAVETCGELQTEAQKCCHQPERCVGGGLAHALDGLGKLNVALGQLGSKKRQCDSVKQTFGMYSGMQGAMASQCMRKASKCTSQCNKALISAVKAFEDACKVDPRQQKIHDSSLSCNESFFNEYRDHIVEGKHGHSDYHDVNISKVGKECQRTGQEANRSIGDMTTNLGGALMASVRECKQAAEQGHFEWETPEPPPPYEPPTPTPPPPLPQPGVPSPHKIAGGGGDTNRPSMLDSDSPTTTPANPFDVNPELEDRKPEMEEGGPTGFGGLVGGQGSGGGSSGGGGGLGGGGGGGGDGYGRGGGGNSRNRQILQGYHGGKFTGYGGSGNARGSGGKGRGWKRNKNKKKKRGMASLDLKKLFPKDKLNKKVGQFGSPHDDIFKRISSRFQYMCKTKRIDCAGSARR